MRIAITGTHGTGKTTLARALSERLGIPMITEVARGIIKAHGFQSTRDYIDKSDIERKKRVQSDILAAQMIEEDKLDDFVADRSVFDAIAYAEAYGIEKMRINIMLGKAIEHALNTYDLLVYVPPVIPIENDGFRDLDEGLRNKVDELLKIRYLPAVEQLGATVLYLYEKDFEKRIDSVIWVAKSMEEAMK